jgi:hypothetical protein
MFDNNSLEFVFAMAKALGKYMKVLEAPIEGFMAGFDSVLEFLDSLGVERVSSTDLCLPLVAFVSNHPLVGGDLAFQTVWLAINRNVILSSREGPIDPHKLIATDRNTKFIGQPSTIMLLGEPSSTWLGAWLIDATMGAVDGDDEDLLVVGVVLLVVPEPLNLVASTKHKQSVRKYMLYSGCGFVGVHCDLPCQP